MDAFEPTAEQKAVIDHRGSHLLVFAGPGTGKTETLARRFASLVHDDRVPATAILVLTFSRRAANAMRERIVLRMRERSGKGIAVPELHVYTFHGFCSRLIDGDRPRSARNLLTPVKERLLWKRVIADVALTTFARDVVSSTGFAAEVLNFIARLKGDGVTSQAFTQAARGDRRLLDLAELYRRMDEQRAKLGLSDFRDLVADAVRDLADDKSAAAAWLRSHGSFQHVLVDEFQDSDYMQLELLEALGRDGAFSTTSPQMCFVGDFNQSIYRFRGADPDNIAKARDRFQCKELGLRLNRRSAQAVLDVANKTPGLRRESLTTAELSRAAGGSVRMLRTETVDDEIAAIADAVSERIRSGTPAGNVAVLLRVVEPYRSAIVQELEARGVPVAAQSTAGFREDALVDAVLNCIRLLAGERDTDSWTRLLTNPVVGFQPLSVSVALGSARNSPAVRNPRRALDEHPPAGRIEWTEFIRRLDACRGATYVGDPSVLVRTIVRELDLLWPIRVARDVPGFDRNASPVRLETLIGAAHDICETSTMLGAPKVEPAAFLHAVDDVISLLGDPYEGPRPGGAGVPVMSIHAAKGLEFDFVVLPQLIDGVLPAHVRYDPLVGNRRIPLVRRVDDAMLEEASLWYVALTRARRDVLATAARLGDEGSEQPLSRFAALIAPAPDVAPPMPYRTQAAGFAAAFEAASDRERHKAAVLEYVGDRPILDAYLREHALLDGSPQMLGWKLDHLSPSQIERYVACPRRWFYQYALGLPSDDDEVTRIGRFVHRVLERFHTAQRDFLPAANRERRVDAIVAALQPIADEEARHVATHSGLSTESPVFRYEFARGVRQLRHYAEWLLREANARPFTVVACEGRVDIALGAIRLVGRVDRVDRLAGGGLIVRDYKSGKMPQKTCGSALNASLLELDTSQPGLGLFGNAPEDLRLQTLLYVRGVEATFGERVVGAEYVYLAGARSETGDSQDLRIDSVAILAGDDSAAAHLKEGTFVTRATLDSIYDVVAAGVAREIAAGTARAFPTAADERTCKWCQFTNVCPGPGTIAYDARLALPAT